MTKPGSKAHEKLSQLHSQAAFDKAPIESTKAQWGDIRFEKREYSPLEKVKAFIEAPERGAKTFRIEWYDGLSMKYGENTGRLKKSKATVSFVAGGHPGMQYVLLWFDPDKNITYAPSQRDLWNPGTPRQWFEDRKTHDRLANFYLQAETQFSTGDKDIDEMYARSRESLRLNRRRYNLAEGEVIGYTTADSGNCMDFWLRDMYYQSLAFSLWEKDTKSGFEALFRRQMKDGSFPDNVNTNDNPQRSNTESDVEYIAVLALYDTWMTTGDDDYLKRNLPAVERGIRYCTSHPKRWDSKTGLVKRGHTCGTWDFDIELFDDWDEHSPAVAANCDQSGLFLAYKLLARMFKYLGKHKKAKKYDERAKKFRARVIKMLWDGEKFQHHLHLDHFDHGAFDESKQLSMGNGWAMTRGLATSGQCRRIIETYLKRWKQTGYRFPWFSLEPGYPVELGKCLEVCELYLRPGGYCNGGMMPFVGACLCTGAFENGEEKLGARLLRDYASFLQERNGEIYTWFWPDMQPGFRCSSRNTTGHDGWGMGHWVESLTRGLAGIKITAPGLKGVEFSPRWGAAGIRKAKVVAHYPSVDRYVAYTWKKSRNTIYLTATGSAEKIKVRLFLPADTSPEHVTLDGKAAEYRIETVGKSRYAIVKIKGPGVRKVALNFKKKNQSKLESLSGSIIMMSFIRACLQLI